MIAVLAALTLTQVQPSLAIERFLLHSTPGTKEGIRAKTQFFTQIQQRRYEQAFHTAADVLSSFASGEATRWQWWQRHELLLLAGRPEAVIAVARQHMRPFGTYKGRVIRRPIDLWTVRQGATTDDLAKLGDSGRWELDYWLASEILEPASVMAGDLRQAHWAVEEQEAIPVMCGTGREPVVFRWSLRKLVYKTAMQNPAMLRTYASGGFKPAEKAPLTAEAQVRCVTAYALFSEAGLSRGPARAAAYVRLAELLAGKMPANDEPLLLRLALQHAR
jgi:hypothetical protein